jgi:ABC-type transport system involved in multi-copper enzyme maturation permease subunit
MRWGLGPVFLYECLVNSRRWQTYAIRSVGVVILLAAIATIAQSRTSLDSVNSWRDYAALGESYFYAIIGVELTLVLLAAPAATAGAICVDRARGTLAHMLATDLSDPEIVLGKLAARLLPILGLVACTWPVLAISSLLGGIDPTALTLAFAIILAVALVGCVMAMTLSVWARKPHEVVLVTYTFWMAVLLIWPIGSAITRGITAPPHWSAVANPYYLAFARYAVPKQVGFWDYLAFFMATLGLSAVLTMLAIWRMRPVACRGTGARRKEPALNLIGRITRRLPGPSLDGNPVFWREWHRVRPSRWMMILIAIVGGATGIACVGGAVLMWAAGLDGFRTAPGFIMGMSGLVIQLSFGLVMLSATAPTSMSEERQRGSLDILAATTLSTRAIVVGKWLGMFRLVPLVALGPGLVALAMATAQKAPSTQPQQDLTRLESILGATILVGTILAHGALIASIGLALAVWIKQQSRAIAASVVLAVLVGAGWPFLVGNIRVGPASEGMMCLSPIVVAIELAETLSSRYGPVAWRTFWWMAFWDIECLVLAFGLLWLTVRTFDGCFGRIPDRRRRTSVLSDVVVLLAAMLGAGSLFGAITIGIKGMPGIDQGLYFGALASALLIPVALLLLAVMGPSLITRTGAPRAMGLQHEAAIVDRRFFAARWWESFRPVLLLAIGPALLGLAVTTAYRPIRVVPKVTTLPDGSREEIRTDPFEGTTIVITQPRMGTGRVRVATAEEIAAMPIQPNRSRISYLTSAILAVLTILADGAAVVSLGLAMGIWLRRRGLAIALSAGLFLIVTVAWPLLYLYLYVHPGYPPLPRGSVLASPVAALVVLLVDLYPRVDLIAEFAWWSTLWCLSFVLLAVVVSALAVWTLDRRISANTSLERDVAEERPAIETVLVGDRA